MINGNKKLFNAIKFLLGKELFETPYCNSATVIVEIPIVPISLEKIIQIPLMVFY
jgi:hypothetical protein